MFELLTTEELFRLPPPQWLIQDIIEQNSISALYGDSGTGKSFIALAWALSVATGTPWGQAKVKQAPVVYIAAEGGRSIQKRVRAWLKHQDMTMQELVAAYFSVKPLYVRDAEEVKQLFDVLDALDMFPGLLVIDTLSQSFGAGDENSMDMQEFVSAVTEIRNERQMAVLVVHHTNAKGARERGHGSFRGGMDHMFQTKAKKDEDFRLQEVTLFNNKQKDTETQPRQIFVPKIYGQSLVLVPGEYQEPSGDGLLSVRDQITQVMVEWPEGPLGEQVRRLSELTGLSAEAAKKRLQRYKAQEDK